MPAPPARMTSAWPRAASARIVENWRTVVTVAALSAVGLSTKRPPRTTTHRTARIASTSAGP
ncbi:hypothetical protein ACHMW4_13855 [Mesorhizobium sp. UC22_110]|uniref:hypothetical protein n=1 Tax=Mesorhizobium sp. UC22_110 TaxID=3374552 RepID=UPI0037564465